MLIKCKNSKVKNANYIGADEYLYVLHPIYTSSFQISWRRKQKIEFDIKEINTLISNNTAKITDLIKNYVKKRKLQDEKIDLDYIQLKLFLTEEDSSVKDSRIRGTSEKGAKIQPRKTEEIRSKGQSIGNG